MLVKEVPAVGNTNSVNSYSESDRNPAGGRNYYRLKMNDMDGTFTYSPVISLDHKGTLSNAVVYPNPVSDRIYVKDMDLSSIVSITVSDIMGQQVHFPKMLTEKGIDVSGLINGIYFMEIRRSNGEMLIRKFVISR